MKKRTIITSVLVIVLCLGLISGSTFALFTSESKVNIAVTAGKVNITATLSDPVLYSADATLEQGTLVDKVNPLDEHPGEILPTDPQGEFAGTYYYKAQQGTTFANGGTAALSDGTLTIDKMTPGDKVATTLTIVNDSNVDIQYRVKVSVLSGLKLYEGLVVKVDNVSLKGVSKTSNWVYKTVPQTDEQKKLEDISLEVYLPLDAGNEYQDLSTSMQITVEAVQGNANVTNEVLAQIVEVTKDVGETNTVLSDADGLVEATVPNTALVDNTSSLTLKVTPTDSKYNIAIETATQEVMAYDVKVLITNTTNSAIQTGNNEKIKVKIFIGTGLTGVKLYHNGSLMETQDYSYNSETGFISFDTTSFSEYSVVYDKDIAVEIIDPVTKDSQIVVYKPTEVEKVAKWYVKSVKANEDGITATVTYASDVFPDISKTEQVRYLTAKNLGSQTTDTTFDIYCGEEQLATGVTFTNVFNGSSTNAAGVNTHILIGRNAIKFPAGDIYFKGDSYVNSEALFMIGSTDGEGNPTTRLLANGTTNSVSNKGLQLENREAEPSTRIHYFESVIFDGTYQQDKWGHLITMTSYAIDAEFNNVVFQNMTQSKRTSVVGIWAGESLHDAAHSYPTKNDNVGVDVRFTNVKVDNINNKPIFQFQGFTQSIIDANENCYSYISVVFDEVSAENCGLNNSSAYATQNGNNNYTYNGTHYYWTVNGVEVSNVEGTAITLGN